MTRSNIRIILSNGQKIKCVADGSSAPEQQYIVENLILPLLQCNNAKAELKLLKEHCTMAEQRLNATYRYELNMLTKKVSFFEEDYDFGKKRFVRGEEITERYETYLMQIRE